jgi:F-type H+-transporting ATPase subunit delta
LAVIANRYAKALVDVCLKLGQSEQVAKELAQFEELLSQNPELSLFYANPAIPVIRKRAATTEILTQLGFSTTTSNFLFVLIHNHRINYLAEIHRAFRQGVNERLGVIQADITTAFPVDQDTKDQLEERLKALTGKKVLLNFGISQEVIGGVITRIGDTIYDGSIRQQLESIKARLSSD